jgi:hypothetical protein
LYRHETELFHRLSTNRSGNPLFLDNQTPIQWLKGGNLTTGIPSGRLVTHPSELNTVELYSSGLIGVAIHPDMQKIRIIGFFFEKRLH